MTRLFFLAVATSALIAPLSAFSDPLDDIAARLTGRSGGASEDRREDVRQLGLKIGCRGDTLEANVKINEVSGHVEGDTAVVSVRYSGDYYRQGWEIPCQKVSSNLGGLEHRHLTGDFSFRVTGKAFQRPSIVWGSGSNYKEVTSPTHDANIFAIKAVKDAILSGF